MIRINKEWRANQLSESLINNRIVNKATALSLSIAALGLMGVSKVNASDVPLPIKKIGLNNENQIVVYFGRREGEFPTPPHLLDTPGPNHRIVIEFADAIVDKVNMPAAADLSTKLHKQLFGIKSIRYVTLNSTDSPRAQVVIEVAEQLKVRPRVIKLEEDSVTINLGDDIVEQSAALEGPVRGRSGARATAMRSSQSQVAEPGAPTMIAQNDSKPEIPTPSNSDADPDVTVTSGRSSAKATEVVAAAPATVQSVAPAASDVADSAVGAASTAAVAPTSTSGSRATSAVSSAPASTVTASSGDGMPALRTAPLAMPAESKPTASNANAARSNSADDESSSQVAESMPSSPKTKAAANSTSPIKMPELKMPETLTNAGANLKKFMHWPHKDDATASASTKDSSKDSTSSGSSSTASSSSKKDVADAKKDSTKTTAVAKQTTSQTTTVATTKTDATGVKAVAKDTKKEVKKEVADASDTSTDSDATKDTSQSKLSKLNLFAKLPRPGFIKPKSPEVVAAAHVNTSKPTKNTVVDAGSDSSDVTAVAAKTTSASSSKTSALATNSTAPASQTPVADAGNSDAAPEGAEFNAAFANQSNSATAKASTSVAPESAPTPALAAVSASAPISAPAPISESATTLASAPTTTPTPSTDNSPAPGSWDWTAASASKPAKQTAVSTASALTAASSGDAVVSKATNATSAATEAAETSSTRPVQVAQDMPVADDKPKISTPIETTETQTFSQPAQMLTPGSSTSVSEGAQEMMKVKAKEQEVKPVTVADTEKSDFAAALKSSPAKKQKVEESAGNEPTLIRDTEMTDPAVEKTATKPVENEAPAGEMPAQVSPETSTAAAAASEPETTTIDKNKLATAKYNEAVKAHLAGKLPEAIAAYKDALAANPELAEAHSNLGLIYNQQHKYELAVSEFQRALAVNPKDAITYNGIGAALRAQKDLPGAIKNFQTAVSLDPKLATAHYNLGVAYELQRDYDRSLNSYEQAIKCDYRLGEAYYRMGMILEKRHRNDDARAKFKAALKASENADYSADARQRLALLESKPTR
jgi:Tfp pilus assembly protein PilF